MPCIDLNAHSLIILIRTLRDHVPDGSDYFLLWFCFWDHNHVKAHLELPGA